MSAKFQLGAGGLGYNRRLLINISLYLKTVPDGDTVTVERRVALFSVTLRDL